MANSFAIPSAVIGLMGRRPQTGRSLLDFINPMQADALDEQMFAAAPNGYVESPEGMYFPADQNAQAAARQQMRPAQSAMPQRERVSGWRVLDRVLGGDTISGGLDAERARLQAEAMRPQQQAEEARLQEVIRGLPLPLQLAFAANKAEAGKAVASNYEGYTLGSGGQRGGMNGIVASAPTYSTVNDTIYANDRGVSTPTAVAAPSFGDVTARNKAESDARLAALGIDINQQNADTSRMNAETTAANSGFTLSGGQERRAADGSLIAAARPATTPASLELQGRVDATRRDVLPTTQRMRSLITSGDVITGFGAGPRLDAARALAATGNEDAKRKVAATQEYQNLSGALRVGIAKSLGANPSNADILLLEKITAGDIGQSQEALLSTIGQAEGRANSLIQDVERQLSQGGGGQPPRVSSVAEAMALPPGTVFTDPNGVRRVRP